MAVIAKNSRADVEKRWAGLSRQSDQTGLFWEGGLEETGAKMQE